MKLKGKNFLLPKSIINNRREVPPRALQKWMGHEAIKTTLKYYVHIPEDFEKEAIEKLRDFRKNDSQGDSSQNKGSASEG